MAMREPTLTEVIECVRASTAAQGLPERVTDAGIVEAVSTLLREGREPVRSESPDQGETGAVEGVAAPDGGIDDDMIEDGGDDGGLPGERETGPSVP